MEGCFTLLFEDPYWVGYFERYDETESPRGTYAQCLFQASQEAVQVERTAQNSVDEPGTVLCII
jgi:hypothetical protein